MDAMVVLRCHGLVAFDRLLQIMPAESRLHLLFAHERGEPFLDDGPDERSAAQQAGPVVVQPYLADGAAAASDIEKQRWAVMAATGADGDRLLSLVADLVARRAEDQGAEVLTIRVPPGMDTDAARHWKQDIYPELYGKLEPRRPRYVCILGDLDQISLPTQQELALDGFPGRLALPSDEDYQAYVDKVLAWERGPSAHERARAIFYTVHDRTEATTAGHEKLVEPCLRECRQLQREEFAQFPASSVEDAGNRDEPDPDELLTLAASDHPAVMFSMSHGAGPPRGRSYTAEEARHRQGAMHFGRQGAIMPEDVGQGSFLPGGLWLYFACFGAGTPAQSAYHHWLTMLEQNGMTGLGPLGSVLKGLDRRGGFVSGIAKAALANPRGPLALIGHLDLAWSYGYEELRLGADGSIAGKPRVRHFSTLLSRLIKGERAGAAFAVMPQARSDVGQELNKHYDSRKQAGGSVEGVDERERLALGHLWMRHQDLEGYVLLGDPAVRLPLAGKGARRRASGVEPVRRREHLAQFLGIGPARAPGARERDDTGDQLADRLDDVEKAILALASGQIRASEAAARLGIAREDAERWARDYCKAGRRALERLVTGQDES
jgi:hypothetical protein